MKRYIILPVLVSLIVLFVLPAISCNLVDDYEETMARWEREDQQDAMLRKEREEEAKRNQENQYLEMRESEERSYEALKEIEKMFNKSQDNQQVVDEKSKEASEEIKEKDITKEDIENITQNLESITLEGPIDGYGTISFTIDFKTQAIEGLAFWSNETSVVDGYIDLKTGLIDGEASGQIEYEGHTLEYLLTMTGQLSEDLNSANGSLINEDGEVFEWNATKVSE